MSSLVNVKGGCAVETSQIVGDGRFPAGNAARQADYVQNFSPSDSEFRHNKFLFVFHFATLVVVYVVVAEQM